jgi:uncharacterized protein YjiS (DUF1127 family)
MRFSPSCSAAFFLFKRLNMTILAVTRFTGAGVKRHIPVLERKRPPMFATLIRFIHQWKQYNRSLNELSRLGDRELADIGIGRSDIQAVAWKSAHQA